MQPLNSDAGRAFLLQAVSAVGAEVVILDNRMSLLGGDMKEEQPWTDTMELVRNLSSSRVAQVWIDHAGHDSSRIYGTKTKEWTFDAVMMLTEADRPGTDIAFQIQFTKARRRHPGAREDFETRVMTLTNGVWAVEGKDMQARGRKLTPKCQHFLDAFETALKRSAVSGQVARPDWFAVCVEFHLFSDGEGQQPKDQHDRSQTQFRKYLHELRIKGYIQVSGDIILDSRSRDGNSR